MQQSIRHKGAVLNFQKAGSGPKSLLVFHGFGQNGESFRELSETLSNQYTVYLFDLFFHGNSVWSEGEKPIEKEFWNEILNQFLEQNSINSFSVLGYSMGGKFALATIEEFPERVKEVFLLAPDGIKTNIWYTIATYPSLLRGLFKSMVLKPNRFQFIASVAYKLGLIDKGILRFAETQMNTEEKRNQVYYSWVVFRHLKFDLRRIANLINSNGISVQLAVGKLDKIMTPKDMGRLVKKLKECKFDVLETGHNGVIRKWSETQKLLQK